MPKKNEHIGKSSPTCAKRAITIAGLCVSLCWTITAEISVTIQLHDLFDPETHAFATAAQLPSWAGLLSRIENQRSIIDSCIADQTQCSSRLRAVRHVLKRGHDLTREQQIRLVNRFINRFSRYRQDKRRKVLVGDAEISISQEWSTLLEFLNRGGDCEDYATAKYQLLRRFDIPADELRVLVVYDRKEREHHAVVGVAEVNGAPLLLDTDNQTYKRRPPMYRFVYALNEKHIWDFGARQTLLKRAVRRELKDLY